MTYNHLEVLKQMGYIPDSLEPIQALENKGHKMAEDECNGDKQYTTEMWEDLEDAVRAKFSKYLNGFILNGDPRGYTLKIDDIVTKKEYPNLYKDWGGYGILSPEFN